MRVLFAAHQFFPEHRAGTEVLTLSLAQALRSRGHETAVLAAGRSTPGGLPPGETEDYEVEGVPVRRVGRPEESLTRSYRLNYDNPRMAARMAEYLREFAPDVVHFTHLQGLSAAVIPPVKEAGLPAVYTATDFWAVCPVVDLRRHDGELCTGPDEAHCPRCLASRRPGSRAAAAVRRTPGPVLRAAAALARSPLPEVPPLRQFGELSDRPAYIRERLNSLDCILVPTRLTGEMLVRNGVRGDLMQHSPYGFDATGIERTEPAERGERGREVRFGFIGTLGPHKGCDLLVRAFRSLPPEPGASLAVYGSPEGFEGFHRDLRRLAEGEGRISFRGTFQPEELGRVLSEMDVLVVPSRWYENAPLVVSAAFSAGVPVVATDVGGLSEAVTGGRDGLLFRLDDMAGLARCLERLVREPDLLPELRRGIGPVKTIEKNAEELESLYNGLVSDA